MGYCDGLCGEWLFFQLIYEGITIKLCTSHHVRSSDYMHLKKKEEEHFIIYNDGRDKIRNIYSWNFTNHVVTCSAVK